MTAFCPGDRVLLRNHPLLPSLIVDRVRAHSAGEPDPNGPVWCIERGPRRFLLLYGQAELVPRPPEYEPPPPASEPWLALRWLNRNRQQLTALHGAETVALTRQRIRERIRLKERIADAPAGNGSSSNAGADAPDGAAQ